MLFDSFLKHKGRTFTVEVERDEDHGAPWDEEDGHGPVSDWTRRSKLPGELVLWSTGNGSKRFYDFAAACKQAREEGWNAAPYPAPGTETRRQQAARAAMADFHHLRRWCGGLWEYVGVTVTDQLTGESESLWGVEDEPRAYLEEVARELADQIIATVTDREAAAIAASRPDMAPQESRA